MKKPLIINKNIFLKKKFIYNLIIKSSYKNTLIFLYSSGSSTNHNLIKQWSIRSKDYQKIEKKKNTKYNLFKMISNLKIFLLNNKIKNINLIFIGRGYGRRYFLNFFLENYKNIRIFKIIDNTPVPFNGCRPSKKKR